MYRLVRFLNSLWWHIYAGSPKAKIQDIKARFNICKKCIYFDKKKSICKECECNISTKKRFLNKLAWADQECPIGKWFKINY
jgi:uncharacterized paraquat-inducible protein A